MVCGGGLRPDVRTCSARARQVTAAGAPGWGGGTRVPTACSDTRRPVRSALPTTFARHVALHAGHIKYCARKWWPFGPACLHHVTAKPYSEHLNLYVCTVCWCAGCRAVPSTRTCCRILPHNTAAMQHEPWPDSPSGQRAIHAHDEHGRRSRHDRVAVCGALGRRVTQQRRSQVAATPHAKKAAQRAAAEAILLPRGGTLWLSLLHMAPLLLLACWCSGRFAGCCQRRLLHGRSLTLSAASCLCRGQRLHSQLWAQRVLSQRSFLLL